MGAFNNVDKMMGGYIVSCFESKTVSIESAPRSAKMFGMFADTLARKSEQFSLDVRLHLTCGDAPEARWACFARDGESPTEAERNIYRYVQIHSALLV